MPTNETPQVSGNKYQLVNVLQGLFRQLLLQWRRPCVGGCALGILIINLFAIP